ncbi:MAG: DUF4491 family protein [Chloroflexota bacterium]|nr:DUF4491 family protein [Chloroflexota bacterium]
MNTTGIFLGLFTAFTIGLGFVWVIKLEYYVGAHTAKAVAALGIAIILVSLFVPVFTFSGILGILGGTVVWGATELPDQEKRVAKGMFPANPRKQARKEAKPPTVGETDGGEI